MSGRELLICLRHVIPALQHLQADLMAQRDGRGKAGRP